MRLKSTRFSAFLLFKEPPSQVRRSDACGLRFLVCLASIAFSAFFQNTYGCFLHRTAISGLPHLPCVNCGARFLARLELARFYAFLLFKEPPSQVRRSDACGLAFLFGTKFPPQSATRYSCGYLRSKFQRWPPYLPCVNCGARFLALPLFTGIFFNTCTAGAP